MNTEEEPNEEEGERKNSAGFIAMGIAFMILGFAFGFMINFGFLSLVAIGFVFLALGITNTKQAKQE